MTAEPVAVPGGGRRAAAVGARPAVAFPSEAGIGAGRARAWTGTCSRARCSASSASRGPGSRCRRWPCMGLLPDRAHVSGSIRLRDRELIGLQRQGDVGDPGPADLDRVPGPDVGADAGLHRGRPGGRGGSGARRRIAQGRRRPSGPWNCSTWSASRTRAAAADAFPHEFSGGMRQRVVIAIAIANDPDLIIADEPTTALDVTVQAQVLDVLATAREVTGAGIVLITHDLGVVAGFADRLMVMYAGRVVESGDRRRTVYARPRMPYTLGLLGAIPRLGERGPAAGADRRPATVAGGLPPGARSRRAVRWRSTPAGHRGTTALPSDGRRACIRADEPASRTESTVDAGRADLRHDGEPRAGAAARPQASRCWRWPVWSSTSPSPRARSSGAPWARCTRSTASASTSPSTKPSAWSANPAAARRRR